MLSLIVHPKKQEKHMLFHRFGLGDLKKARKIFVFLIGFGLETQRKQEKHLMFHSFWLGKLKKT